MSRIRFILLGLLVICITTLSFGQPSKCTNPGGGISLGGTFNVTPQQACLDYTSSSSTISVSGAVGNTGGALTNLGYIFDFKEGDDIVFPTTSQTTWTVSSPGVYWILQGGNENSIAYVTCKAVEIIQTEAPDFTISQCGATSITVKFLDTPKNRKHGKYRIVWGDGDQSFSAQVTVWPHEMAHTYAAAPASPPQIEALYTRGSTNFVACTSTSPVFLNGFNSEPRISELEGLSGGTSSKITMVDGLAGSDYIIEQKPKNGSWVDTGKKINRANSSTSANETITGLDGTKEYCFRLKTVDACNNVSTSNEVCTIVPKATIVSSKIAKLNWNSPDPNVTRYAINYSESPSGANPNTGAPNTPTETSYTFDALDCTKKYNFGLTAYLGTTPADRVLIKSPFVLVDPATTPKFEPKVIATVSVSSPTLISFNVFEPNAREAKYIFYRSEGGSTNFTKVKETTENFYNDQNVEPEKQQYCYKVEYQDQCGNSSEPSPVFCSVFLTSNQPNTLNWTPFVIPSPNTSPVEYYVEIVDENGNTQSVDLTTDITLGVKAQIDNILNNPNALGKAKFMIKAVQRVPLNVNGSIISWPFTCNSNIYTFITPAQIYVPVAFSPNDDGNNDTFSAKGRFIVTYNLEIYDRWGNVIFESNDIDTGWNGTGTDGVTPAPPGNYGFKIFGLDPAGQKFEKVGSITLVR
ncbi:hypothetical protein EMA8858_00302 [Emticicia aquatica]|uniref:Fibronectin type-III domain-containing protein n=1 Tax=Emticicia aquatica TaxID=1681835 RepID=A0ABN8EMW5_9BACT|nr:gliding motility-associated C-terminal domain-containing protein [Emticicia aquatica]CAH0994194.1 hypothetical protein EMA8858_00302 [Emticicia aquatica]